MNGATWDGDGVRFTLPADRAERVQLCLFEGPEAPVETDRRELERRADGRWQLYLPGAGPGLCYGYRAHGPWQPSRGDRFNPARLLVDPWARQVAGSLAWDPRLDPPADPAAPGRPNPRDSAPCVPRSVVVDERYDWAGDRPPAVPWSDTLIYECHVRGMTRLHEALPADQRGTYRGLAHPRVIAHLRRLGVTALELLPVHQIGDELHLQRSGLTNYFGYSPLALFAPHAGYAMDRAAGAPLREFRDMVRALHAAGIEVLLDVVLNHTAEGGPGGPTLSLRGLDNRAYYRLRADDPALYDDSTGCGNSLDLAKPRALELALACLRHWVEAMHVDGFRFDLATSLGRVDGAFRPNAPLLAAIVDDPVLSRVKLIAEPWDLGPAGHRLGHFPPPFAEWNDLFRDAARSFWRGDRGSGAPLRRAFLGSHQRLPVSRRGPHAAIQFVTCHDGFTLADLVSYERKHNEANGEANHDGGGNNLSCNWGVEGPTGEPGILAVRRRVASSLLATLALARGVPMLSHGDELGRSQGGNNNPYCQDNPTTWIDWRAAAGAEELIELTARLFALRRELGDWRAEEARWIAPDGRALSDEGAADRCFGLLLERDRRLIALFNAGARARLFRLPGRLGWRVLVSTAGRHGDRLAGSSARLAARSLLLLAQRPESGSAS